MILEDVFCIRLKRIEIQAERLIDPRLKMRPVAVISSSSPNGSIVCLSKEAQEEGLSVGMKVSLIKKMNHSVQLLPYNTSLYNRMNNYLFQIVSKFTPIVEPNNYEKFYLDMKGIPSIKGDIKNNALSIMNSIYQKTHMKSVIGIGSNKLISQIIANVSKDQILRVNKGQEATFLSPFSPNVLPLFKQKSIKRLIKFLWIKKIRDIQEISTKKEIFSNFFGTYSKQLNLQSHGKDFSIVQPPYLRDHILKQIILREDTNNEQKLYAYVKNIGEQLSFKLRKRRQIAEKLRLEIHYSDGFKSEKIGKLESISRSSVIFLCNQLFKKANYRRNRIRSILLDASHFKLHLEQTNLFDNQKTIERKICKAIDQIRSKYGFDSIKTADIFQLFPKS